MKHTHPIVGLSLAFALLPPLAHAVTDTKTAAQIQAEAAAAEVVYDLSGFVPLAYGKNKKGEPVVCEFSAPAGTNLKEWHCMLMADLEKAEGFAKEFLSTLREKGSFSTPGSAQGPTLGGAGGGR
jgi:hypothetical protein